MLQQIHDEIYKSQEKFNSTALFTTDLTSAYDTVDSVILNQQLDHYGIRDKELTLLTSFLTERKQYVEVDTFKSPVLKSPSCSVVQGRKIIWFAIYCIYKTK